MGVGVCGFAFFGGGTGRARAGGEGGGEREDGGGGGGGGGEGRRPNNQQKPSNKGWRPRRIGTGGRRQTLTVPTAEFQCSSI